LDALAKKEDVSWVWGGYEALDEGAESCWDRALVILSPGGSDAHVVREFDLDKCEFVPEAAGGFVVPEGKSSVSFRTRDELLVGTDFGEDSLTASGYPRVVKSWMRGTPLSQAVTVFEGSKQDISADQVMFHDRGFWHEFRHRSLDFYNTSKWYRQGDPKASAAESLAEPFVKIPVPDDASVGTFRDAAVVSLRSDWDVDGRSFKAGSLISLKLIDCMAGVLTNAQVEKTKSPNYSFGLFFRFCVFFYFPGPGTLQKRSGTCLNASGVFFASNLHLEMGHIIGQSIRSKHLGIFTFWGVLLPALRGEHIFEKMHPNRVKN